jgi:3-methyladenine DNA glycosylase AlkD
VIRKEQAMAAKKTAGTATKTAKAKAPPPRSTLASVMRELEQAGSEQTRKTYKRHGAEGPMFGVSFATLKALVKRIGVDHELALALWRTGNLDARNLAVKIADPARMTPSDLDRWATENGRGMCGGYVAMLAGEGPHAAAKLQQWLAAEMETQRAAGWVLVCHLASRDEVLPDAFFADLLARIERTIRVAPNGERQAMHDALIQIGGRSAALRKAATAAAKRIGDPEIDHGDTDCKTRDAAEYIAKTWAHSTSKGFASPAAHERTRETLRTRC